MGIDPGIAQRCRGYSVGASPPRGAAPQAPECASMSQAFFLSGRRGELACRYWPGDAGRAPVLLVPPLHEEMNRARVQLRRIGEYLQARGHSVLLGDLYGSGDSAGEFGEATLSQWQDDVETLLGHLLEHHARTPVPVALRGGALLIPHDCARWIACFPLQSGQQQIQQWLRQRLYVARFQGEDIDREALLARWRSSGIEVGGYALSPSLLGELETASLPPLMDTQTAALVIEWQQPQPSPAFAEAVARGALGWRSLPGPAFWQTAETRVIEALPQAIAEGLPA
jgi:exosortase A-associated hydrolase 2